MIPILSGENLELEVDSNPNGLPYIIVNNKYGARFKCGFALDIRATELLIKELQEKLEEIK